MLCELVVLELRVVKLLLQHMVRLMLLLCLTRSLYISLDYIHGTGLKLLGARHVAHGQHGTCVPSLILLCGISGCSYLGVCFNWTHGPIVP